jgi:large subunit ribosomal protein L2
MAQRRMKPVTPGSRGMTQDTFEELTLGAPEPSLVITKKRASGRNNQGRITVRHRGGGARRKLRIVDYVGREGEGTVVGIAYDPGRSSRLALIEHADGTKTYQIAAARLRPGSKIVRGEDAKVQVGHRRALRDIPVGTAIYNIELTPGRGGALVRSAGTSAQLMAKEGKYAQVRLPSGEVRLINQACEASMGVVGNADHQNRKVGKAGRTRKLGIRPTVRGKAMNPVDHPHGGGEGGTSIALPSPKTPWGVPTLGFKTRNRKRTDKFILRSRKEKRR